MNRDPLAHVYGGVPSPSPGPDAPTAAAVAAGPATRGPLVPAPGPAADDAGGRAGPAGRATGRIRRALAVVPDVLAVLLVQFVLVAPNRLDAYGAAAFARLPLEGLVGVVLVLAVPAGRRRAVVVAGGVVLALLTGLKLVDTAFFAVLVRPFDASRDASLFAPGLEFLTTTFGEVGAAAVMTAVALVALAVPIVMIVALGRLTRLVVRHDAIATRAVAALAAGWLVCAVLGVQTAHGGPLAARDSVTGTYEQVGLLRAGLRDRRVFATEAAVDAFGSTPGDRLLPGLHGKDVVLAFVESYGRTAVRDPRIARQVEPVLADGERRLAAAGFSARSGFLTSTTRGGGSWFAHSTLLSGLSISDGTRYRPLMRSNRLTLNGAFHRAGWRTVGIMPGVTRAWPEAEFYGYDELYDLRGLHYTGPPFSWSPAPDQYALATLQSTVMDRVGRPPVMVEVGLTSSHAPWAPLPTTVPWTRAGDSSVYRPMPDAARSASDVWPDPTSVRAAYADSLRYSLGTLLSWIETYGDDDLVVMFLGDHEPLRIVTGPDAGRDVPISIVAKDPAVLDQVGGWRWEQGLRPGPDAPVWPMEDFRDRFLTAFGSTP
jgi:hypothetical protein